jgi:hypothetical protein
MLILLTPLSRALLQKLIAFQLLKTFPPLTEPGSLLSCSQKYTFGPNLELDESSSHNYLYILLKLILRFHLKNAVFWDVAPSRYFVNLPEDGGDTFLRRVG